MKRFCLKIGASILITILAVMATSHLANASTADWLASFFGLANLLNYILAWIFNSLLTITGWVLAISGTLLNFSINFTLKIKDFVDNAPGIYMTWKALRDITGLFFIFFLLYAAIMMIIGQDAGNYGYRKVLTSIVVAGILVNFSFFFTGLGIDASNIVSVQLYNAIAPLNKLTANSASLSAGQAGTYITNNLSDGGISSIFMNSLKITKIYNTNRDQTAAIGKSTTSTTLFDALKIVLTGVVGIMIEIMAIFSFGAASLAFIGRFVILLFLLAFSPIWFLGFLPRVGDYTKKWKDWYTGMLLFMPVYLLLMYFAMNVLTTTPLFTASTTASAKWYTQLMSLAVNATIVVFLLNMPLVAAASLTSNLGKIGSILGGAAKRFGAEKIFGSAGSSIGRWSYQGTAGRAASKIADSEMFKDLASRSRVTASALKGTRAVAEGYNKKLAAQVKGRTDFADSLGYNQRAMNREQASLRAAQQNLASLQSAAGSNPSPVQQAAIDAADAAVGAAKGRVSNVENQRKKNYGGYIAGTPPTQGTINSGSAQTLYAFVARKDKVASAKIQIPILEKELTARKDSLKETRADIKQLMNAIRSSPAGPGGVPPAGTPTGNQQADLRRLQGEEVTKLARINAIESHLDTLKLTK